jgi:hypothetical protein
MHYATRLKDEIQTIEDTRADARGAITDFLAYLESSKFHDDPTIQSAEVHRFLMNLRMLLS